MNILYILLLLMIFPYVFSRLLLDLFKKEGTSSKFYFIILHLAIFPVVAILLAFLASDLAEVAFVFLSLFVILFLFLLIMAIINARFLKKEESEILKKFKVRPSVVIFAIILVFVITFLIAFFSPQGQLIFGIF